MRVVVVDTSVDTGDGMGTVIIMMDGECVILIFVILTDCVFKNDSRDSIVHMFIHLSIRLFVCLSHYLKAV